MDFYSIHFEKFNEFRYLIGPPRNYYYLVQSIDRKIETLTNDIEIEYKNFLRKSADGENHSFKKKFFHARKRLREKDREQWFALIFSYDFLGNVRGLLSEFRDRFFVITTRDRDSVLDILDLYNLNILDSNIFAKTEYTLHNSKVNIIQSLIEERKIEKSIFIDDLEEHLVECETISNLSAIQAKWGYVVPEKREDNSILLLKELERFVHGENVRT